MTLEEAIVWKHFVTLRLGDRILVDTRRDCTVAQYFRGDHVLANGVADDIVPDAELQAECREIVALEKLRAVMEANGLPKESTNG